MIPRFVPGVLSVCRKHPMGAVGLGLLGVAVVSWYAFGQGPLPGPTQEQPYWQQMKGRLPGAGVQRAGIEGALTEVQDDNRALKQALEEQKRLMQQMLQEQKAWQVQAQAKQAAQEQQLDALSKQGRAPAQRPAPRQEKPMMAPVPKAAPVVQGPTTVPGVGIIKRLRSQEAGPSGPIGPSITRDETAYVAPGCHAKARVVTGVFATVTQETRPMLLAITSNLYCPAHLQGPEAEPLETSVPLKGCLVLGQSSAALAEERAHVLGEKMVCVFPDKATIEPEIKAYVTGKDGTLGIPGKVERRTGAFVAQSAMASILAGASEAAAAYKRTVAITPLGGALQTQGGNIAMTAPLSGFARGSEQLSQWALRQAEKLLPVLWVQAGEETKIVFQEGVPLEGLPTQAVSYR